MCLTVDLYTWIQCTQGQKSVSAPLLLEFWVSWATSCGCCKQNQVFLSGWAITPSSYRCWVLRIILCRSVFVWSLSRNPKRSTLSSSSRNAYGIFSSVLMFGQGPSEWDRHSTTDCLPDAVLSFLLSCSSQVCPGWPVSLCSDSQCSCPVSPVLLLQAGEVDCWHVFSLFCVNESFAYMFICPSHAYLGST